MSQNVSLRVTGMHCEKCEARINRFVGKIPGVESVSAHREEERVDVAMADGHDVINQVKSTITELGFSVE